MSMSRETDLAAIVADFLHRIDDEEGGTIDVSPEPSCRKCTYGTTPNDWAKGDCLRHRAEALLKPQVELDARNAAKAADRRADFLEGH